MNDIRRGLPGSFDDGPRAARPRAAKGAVGFTLIELCVVVVILATLAALAIQAANGATADAAAQATRAQLSTLRQSILGIGADGAIPSYRRDCRMLPLVVADLLRRRDLPRPFPVDPFDPTTGFGWRGPYVFVPRGEYLRDQDLPSPPRNFLDRYGATGDPAVVDGWGRPVVLQYPNVDGNPSPPHTPDEQRHVRLVSAGENGRIDTPVDAGPGLDVLFPALTPDNDDVVLYLHVADLRPRLP